MHKAESVIFRQYFKAVNLQHNRFVLVEPTRAAV